MLIKIHFATGLLVLIVVIRAVGFSPLLRTESMK